MIMKHSEMYKIFITVVLSVIFFSCSKGKKYEESVADIKYQTVQNISEEDLRYHIGILASDSLEGRKAGSVGEKKAGEHINDKFSELGLRKFSDDYYHPFSFLPRWPIYQCELSFGSFEAIYRRDFTQIVPTDSSVVSSDVVFIGNDVNYSKNGFFLEDYQYIDIENKWVMVFEEKKLNATTYKLMAGMIEGSGMKNKNSASGILAIYVDEYSHGILVPLWYNLSVSGGIGSKIPVIRISQRTADSLFKYVDTSTKEISDGYEDKSFSIPVNVNASVFMNKDSIKSNNIMAYLEGKDSVLRDEYIVLGAHYDHVGTEKVYNILDEKNLIFNGADDNASGVAGMLEIAERLVSEGNTKRSIIFMAYGAEEEGLIGSDFICKNLPVPASKIKLMVNLDMIGRLDSGKLFINTVVAGTPAEKTVRSLSLSYPDLNLRFTPNKRSNSDHFPFLKKNIPVIMLTTGEHKDYHTPNDTIDAINYKGEKRLLGLAYDLIVSFAEKIESN
jgi:Predicted aminopeptidases